MSAVVPAMAKVRVPRPVRSGSVTFDEFYNIIREDQKADLLDGVIYMASPESLDANDLFVWLIRLIADFVDHHDLGKVYGSRVCLRIDDRNGPEPDVTVVLNSHRDRLQKAHIAGACDLAIEIVSPESVVRDYDTKRALYQRAGVTEYWIVDEELKRITALHLGPKGYVAIRPRARAVTSKVLPGFWLRPAWCWQRPLPRKAEVLAEVLAGPPK